MDAVQDDYDSSELEFSDNEVPAAASHRHRGQASIDRMIANAAQSRISSKKTVKQLKFTAVAPGTESAQSLWINRFNGFREHVLHQSIDTPFTGSDMIRFLDTIIGEIQPRDSNKPVPSLDVVHNAFRVLLRYGTFRWSKQEGFNITPHDGARFRSFTTQAVHEKRLTKGAWRKRSWVGFVTLSRMTRDFLEHFIRHGSWNFDVVISKCLSIVLIASLSCRSGDVSRSQGYTSTQYLHYEHIELYLEPEASRDHPPRFQDLRATFTLEYMKGHKDTDNDSLVRYFRPLDIHAIHVCPISILLVHALRNGLVYGSTVEEVLGRAASRPDLHIEWRYPKRPVLTKIARKPSRCDLDAVSSPDQVLHTIKQMGLVSGMLSRVYGHSLRLGGLRDYANLPKAASRPSTDEVRKFAGHNFSTMQKGVTEKYTGDIAQDYYNDRAENGGVIHRREPKFAASGQAYLETIKQRVSVDEMQEYADRYMPGRDAASLSGSARRTLQEGVRRERRDTLAASAAAGPPAARRAASKPTAPALLYTAPAAPPQLSHAPAKSLPLRNKTTRPANKPRIEQDDIAEDYQDEPLSTTTPLSNPPRPQAPEGGTSEDTILLSNIDPALLDDETLESLQVDSADVDALEAVIFPGVSSAGMPDADNEPAVVAAEEDGNGSFDSQEDPQGVAPDSEVQRDTEEAARLLLGREEPHDGDSGSSPPAWTTPKDYEVWINGYARHNVVNNTNFASTWRSFSEGDKSFEESIGKHSMRGNSRDEPTPHVFTCRRTEGCVYTAIKQGLIDQHERNCSVSYVEAASKQSEVEVLKCDHTGCTYKTTAGKRALNKHIGRAHKWTPTVCDDCDDEVLYQSPSSLEKHKEKVHSGRWPSKCLFPGCPNTTDFGDRTGLINHLKVKHGLPNTEACEPYLPAPPDKTKWVQQKCVVSTCKSGILWKGRSQMLSHLTSVHKMDAKDAGELIDREARTEKLVRKANVLGPAGNARKKRSSQSVAPAPGKENSA